MADGDEFVRVQTENGLETSVSRAYLDSLKESGDDGGLKVLEDQPAALGYGRTIDVTRSGGRPLLPTTSVDEEVAKQKSSQKESSK